jgi:hypothetical protein
MVLRQGRRPVRKQSRLVERGAAQRGACPETNQATGRRGQDLRAEQPRLLQPIRPLGPQAIVPAQRPSRQPATLAIVAAPALSKPTKAILEKGPKADPNSAGPAGSQPLSRPGAALQGQSAGLAGLGAGLLGAGRAAGEGVQTGPDRLLHHELTRQKGLHSLSGCSPVASQRYSKSFLASIRANSSSSCPASASIMASSSAWSGISLARAVKDRLNSYIAVYY